MLSKERKLLIRLVRERAKLEGLTQPLRRTTGIAPMSDPKAAVFFYYKEKGHEKCSCPKYLEDLKKNKVKGIDTLGIYMVKLHEASTSNSWILDT